VDILALLSKNYQTNTLLKLYVAKPLEYMLLIIHTSTQVNYNRFK